MQILPFGFSGSLTHLKRLKIKCDKQIPCQSCQVCHQPVSYIEGPTLSVCNSEEVVQLYVQMVCKFPNAYLILLIFAR